MVIMTRKSYYLKFENKIYVTIKNRIYDLKICDQKIIHFYSL